MNLADAVAVKVGENDAVAVYQGTEQVWSAVPAYAAVVMEDAPLTYLRFTEDDGASVATDISGNDLHAEYVGDIELEHPGPIASDPGSRAVRTFGDASHPRVRWANAHLWVPDGAFTFEHWIYKETTTQQATWSFGASNAALAYVQHTTTDWFQSSATSLAHNRNIVGSWVHHVITHDGVSALKLYLDGVLEDTKSKTTINIPGSDPFLVLGQEQDSDDGGYQTVQAHQGLIAEPAVYDYDLSAERVLAHYDAAS